MQKTQSQISSSSVGLIDGCTLIKLPVDELAGIKGPEGSREYLDYSYVGDQEFRSETYEDTDNGCVNYSLDDMYLIDRLALLNDRDNEWENEVQMFS